MPTDEQISVINVVIDTVNANLTKIMQDLVDSSDQSRAGLVRAGKLQDDPTQFGVSVLTHENDPVNPESWRHAVVSGPGATLVNRIPAYEIGTGEMWFRRFTTEIKQFWLPSASRETARRFSSLVLSRAEQAIKTTPLTLGKSDSFGETPLAIFVASSLNREAGGEGQFIWEANIWFQCLTGKV